MASRRGFEYRDIPGFPDYRVRSDGTVWRVLVGGTSRLSIYRRPYGGRYVVVCMRAVTNGKVSCHYVHRLMLESFVGPCPPGMQACHNDGNTANNAISNLRWDTPPANNADKKVHGTQRQGSQMHLAKLTEGHVVAIRILGQTGLGQKEIGAMFGIQQTTVGSILRNEDWKHVDDLYVLNLLGKRPDNSRPMRH